MPFQEGPKKSGQKRRSTNNLIRTCSKLGLCSRSQALMHVLAGRVTVNGRVEKDPGYIVKHGDKIRLAGEAVKPQPKRYFLFHKPAGCVTTRSDELGRKTIYDWLGEIGSWVFPVGRLDLDSEGLLVMTNDTDFGHKLTEPSFKVPRTYEVWTEGILSEEDQAKIRRGPALGRGETAKPVKLKIIKSEGSVTHAELILTEGRNREIRRMFENLGKPVTRLLRTHFGPFSLGDLKPGVWKEIQFSGEI